MRPAIKPGLLVVWRDQDTLQIGIDPRRAVALSGMGRAAALIGLLDGSREHSQVLTAAEELGIPREAADRVIGLLAAAGAVQDFPAAALRALPDGPRARLARELAMVSLAHGHADGGARVLARRQAASVRVYGGGLVGPEIGSLLTASGVGHVACTGPVGPPSTPARRPRPRRRGGTLTGAALPGWPPRSAPRRGAASQGPPPDLVVLADGYPPELPAELVASGVVHLAVSAREAIGVVGPLVLPGESACLGCVELARADRDPAWPFILAQLAGQAAHPVACAATLATAVAAQAVSQVLSCLDLARPDDAVINGTLELVSPSWQWRRRSWPRHDRCGCSTRSATCPRM
jgi:hypothetical protein